MKPHVRFALQRLMMRSLAGPTAKTLVALAASAGPPRSCLTWSRAICSTGSLFFADIRGDDLVVAVRS